MLNPAPQQDLVTNHLNEIEEFEVEGYEAVVRKARNALFWAGGLIFAGEMISMFQMVGGFDPYIFGIGVLEAGVFIGLAFYTRKKPHLAIVIGLIAFCLIILISATLSAMTMGIEGLLKSLVGGIIVKIAILIALIRPLGDAKELQRIKAERKILG